MAAGNATVRRFMVAGNWKMHHDHLQAIRTVQEIGVRLPPEVSSRVEVVVHPPFTDLRSVQTVLEDRAIPLVLGAQHCAGADSGPFTGEIAAPMLARLGVRYVLVGHSERRQLFAESDEKVAAAHHAVLRHGMVPVLCVGETGAERAAEETEAVLERQVRSALSGVDPGQADLVLAYEPVWAIGTGVNATPADAQLGCAHVRRVVAASLDEQAAQRARVLYGGSVVAENTAQLMAGADVDGVLVGGASLQADSFCAIAVAAASVPVH